MRRPLSVVGRDQDALVALLSLHACPEPRILDVTHNEGRMWKGLPYKPHRSDRDPSLHERGFTDTVADFRALPFADASFDVIVFDPPHIGDANASIMGGNNFGVEAEDMQRGWESVSEQFAPFLHEARRVLTPGTGVVLAKIADQVTRGRYRFQHIALHDAALASGMTPCDLFLTVQWARGGLIDPKWVHVNHARQVHCYWLALRNGAKCISPTAPLADVKPRTAEMFVA